MELKSNICNIFEEIAREHFDSTYYKIPIEFSVDEVIIDENKPLSVNTFTAYLRENSETYKKGEFSLVGPLKKVGDVYHAELINYKMLKNVFMLSQYGAIYDNIRSYFVADLEDNLVMNKCGYCYNENNEMIRLRVLVPFKLECQNYVLEKMISFLMKTHELIFNDCMKINGFDPTKYELESVDLTKAEFKYVLIESHIKIVTPP